MTYPDAYYAYLRHFHGTRDYFECHEVLEDYWKTTPTSRYREQWHGLIQIAVGLYHHRRGNVAGARKMLTSAVVRLDDERTAELGLDREKLVAMLEQYVAHLAEPYRDVQLPLADAELVAYVASVSGEEAEIDVVNKHLVRDRSEVVAARDAAVQKRKAARQDRFS